MQHTSSRNIQTMMKKENRSIRTWQNRSTQTINHWNVLNDNETLAGVTKTHPKDHLQVSKKSECEKKWWFEKEETIVVGKGKGKRSGHKTANQCMMPSHQVLLPSNWCCATESEDAWCAICGEQQWCTYVENKETVQDTPSQVSTSSPHPHTPKTPKPLLILQPFKCGKGALNWPHLEITWGPCWATE